MCARGVTNKIMGGYQDIIIMIHVRIYVCTYIKVRIY